MDPENNSAFVSTLSEQFVYLIYIIDYSLSACLLLKDNTNRKCAERENDMTIQKATYKSLRIGS